MEYPAKTEYFGVNRKRRSLCASLVMGKHARVFTTARGKGVHQHNRDDRVTYCLQLGEKHLVERVKLG